MEQQIENPLEWLRHRLEVAINSYCANPESRIGHGNLRHECSQWRRSATEPTNIAVIYETPGGSTTQINISYDPQTGCFSYLSQDLAARCESADPAEVLHMVEEHVRTIPEKREQQLRSQVDHWVDQGMSRTELFAQLNKLLQAEFLGGRITTQELQRGIQYAIRQYAAQS